MKKTLAFTPHLVMSRHLWRGCRGAIKILLRKFRPLGRGAGFTLVELLIASAIFSVVIVTIYSAFHTGVFSYTNIEETIFLYQTASKILGRLNFDLRNAFTYSDDLTKFVGENKKLSFLTLIDSYQEDKILPEYAFVSYRLEQDKLLRLYRKSKESLNEKSQIQPEEIASYIENIVFSYVYKDATEELLVKDFWDDSKVLPLAVRVELTLKSKTRLEFKRTIFLPLS